MTDEKATELPKLPELPYLPHEMDDLARKTRVVIQLMTAAGIPRETALREMNIVTKECIHFGSVIANQSAREYPTFVVKILEKALSIETLMPWLTEVSDKLEQAIGPETLKAYAAYVESQGEAAIEQAWVAVGQGLSQRLKKFIDAELESDLREPG